MAGDSPDKGWVTLPCINSSRKVVRPSRLLCAGQETLGALSGTFPFAAAIECEFLAYCEAAWGR
jgi:hypothetical protein